jgi:hypothetical protein
MHVVVVVVIVVAVAVAVVVLVFVYCLPPSSHHQAATRRRIQTFSLSV